MTDQSGGGAAETEREMREHEEEALRRDSDERGPGTGADRDAENSAPPGNVQTGEISGGS
jgi:hypothetical protein